MIMSIVYRFTLPSYLACGAIYGDWSGEPDEEKRFDEWVEKTRKELALEAFYCVSTEDNSHDEFNVYHDYGGPPCNTETFIFHGVSMLHPLPLQHHRRLKALNVLVRHNGKLYTRKELVELLISRGYQLGNSPDGRALINPDTGYWVRESDLTKTSLDYADTLIAGELVKALKEVGAM
jgi:hypothetical protein